MKSAEILIRNGASTNDVDVFSRAPLDYAVRANDVELASLLLSNSAKLELCDDGGSSAMLAAVMEVEPDILALLLEHGASPNCILNTESGFSLLDCAAMHGKVHHVRMLIDAGRDPQLADGTSAIEKATQVHDQQQVVLKGLGLDH